MTIDMSAVVLGVSTGVSLIAYYRQKALALDNQRIATLCYENLNEALNLAQRAKAASASVTQSDIDVLRVPVLPWMMER